MVRLRVRVTSSAPFDKKGACYKSTFSFSFVYIIFYWTANGLMVLIKHENDFIE